MGGPMDVIRIDDLPCGSVPLEIRIEVRGRTELRNDYSGKGTFFYSIDQGPTKYTQDSKLWLRRANELTTQHFLLSNPSKGFMFEVHNDPCETTIGSVHALTFQGESRTELRVGKSCSNGFSLSIQSEGGGFTAFQRSDSRNYVYPNCSARATSVSVTGEKLGIRCTGISAFVDVSKYDPVTSILPGIFTTDGGTVSLVPRNAAGAAYSGILYFQLGDWMNSAQSSVYGSLETSNVFDLISGTWDKIEGGRGDDQFRLDSLTTVNSFVGNGGEDSIEIKSGSNNPLAEVNLNENYILFPSSGSKIRLVGEFSQISGREDASEILSTGCGTKYVNLRGFQDKIIIPDLQCTQELQIQFQVFPGTQVTAFYKHTARLLFNIVENENNLYNLTSVLLLNHTGNSTHSFIQLTTSKASELKLTLPKIKEPILKITNPKTDLNISVHFSFAKPPTIMSTDGGSVTFRQNSDSGSGNVTYLPLCYFELNQNSRFKDIIGNPFVGNIFKINSTLTSITSQSLENHVIIGSEARVDIISILSNENSTNILELDNFRDHSVQIDLLHKVIEIKSPRVTRSTHLNAGFAYVFGRTGIPDTLMPDCSARVIDLRSGTGSGNKSDFILISDKAATDTDPDPNCPFNMTIWLRGFIRVENGGSGRFVYFLPKSEHKDLEVKVGISVNSESEHIFSLDYPAQDLKLVSTSGGRFSIQSLSSNHTLEIVTSTVKNAWRGIRITTSDSVEILLDQSGEPIFKFQLSNSTAGQGQDVFGGKYNKNYFLIDGHFNCVHGGEKDDTFLIGSGADIVELDGGPSGEEILQIHESLEGTTHVDLKHNFLFFEFFLSKLTLNGNFVHFVGRAESQEILTLSPSTKTVDLLGSLGATEKDIVFIPPLRSTEFYDVLIKVQTSDQFLIVNALDQKSKLRNKVIYQIPLVEGHYLILKQRESEAEEDSADEADQAPNKVSGEIWSLPSSFFDLVEIQVDLLEHKLNITHRQPDSSLRLTMSLQTKYFNSYDGVKNDLVNGLEPTLLHFHTDTDTIHETEEEMPTETTNTIFEDQDQEVQEPEMIPIPPKLPTILTADNYQLHVNHLGGIHATSTYSLEFPSAAAVLEIIEEHVEAVNNLGVSLILTLVNSADSTPCALIMFGGDDELDALMNDRSLPSHLVGSAGGERNYFLIFPTLPQSPVYIYMYDTPEENDFPSNNRAFILNLASFFDTPENIITNEANSTSSQSLPPLNLPTIEEYGDNDLRMIVRYSFQQDVYDEPNSMNYAQQEVIIVNGKIEYSKLQVVLYVANYRIEREFDSTTKSWHWNLEALPLHLNPNPPATVSHVDSPEPRRRLKRSLSAEQDERDAEIDEPTTRYVFLSMEDLMEYRDFGAPLQLGNHDLKMGEKSFYRNGNDVILTNKVDPDPGFQIDWSGVFGRSQEDPNSYITIVLMDMKSVMEEDGLEIEMDLGSNSKEQTTSVTIDSSSVEQLMDYGEALIEMKKQQSSHQKLSYAILFFVILVALGLLFIFLYFVIRQVRRRKTYNLNTTGKTKQRFKLKSVSDDNVRGHFLASESSCSENEDLDSYLDINYTL